MRTPERLNNHKIVPPVAPPDDAIWDLFSERWDMPGGAAATEAYSSEKIDLDNDGQVEAVYSFHSVTRYRIADILFVSPNANVAASWPVVTVESLFEASPYIFPHSAAVCAFQPCKGEDAKVFRLRNYRHKGEWIDFRLRYLNVWPFVWRKSAYLLLFSAEEYIKTSAVIRLEKARRVSEVCIFQEEE
jgi:hypothetical protein